MNDMSKEPERESAFRPGEALAFAIIMTMLFMVILASFAACAGS